MNQFLKGIFKPYTNISILKIPLQTILISECAGCKNPLIYKQEHLVCHKCQEKIAQIRSIVRKENKCQFCGIPMDHYYPICGNCILNPPLFRKHTSFLPYKGEFKEIIISYKYKGIEKLKHLLVRYYLELFYEEINESFNFIIPVPPDKKRKRDYDPLFEIVKIFSKKLNIPLISNKLSKIRKTDQQVKLTRSKRLKNLRNAFHLKNGIQFQDKKVLLMDDVYTTGTTIYECVKLFKEYKTEIVVLTLARS